MSVRVVRLACLSLGLLLWLCGPAMGQRLGSHVAQAPAEPVDVEAEAWAEAPDGRWSTHGGSAARSGASRTQLPSSAPFVAWSRELDDEIEGEPLAWDQLVIVSARTGKGRRTLYALDRRTGEVLDEQAFRSEVPLEPSLWADRVLLRAEPQLLQLLQLSAPNKSGGRRFDTLWEHELTGHVGAPLLLGNEVYVIADGRLMRLTPGADEPVTWSLDDEYHGRPSVRGDWVWALRLKSEFDEDWFDLVQLSRRDGSERIAFPGPTLVGLRDVLEREVDWRLVVLDTTVHIYTDVLLDVMRPDGTTLKSASYGMARLQEREANDLVFVNSLGERVEAAGRAGVELLIRGDDEPMLEWLEHLRDEQGALHALREDAGAVYIGTRGDLARCRTALTLAGHHGLIGPVAVLMEAGGSFESWRAWRAPVDPRLRMVPVRDGLLAVSGDATLSFLESRLAGIGTSIEPLDDRVEVDGRAVLRDGRVVRGDLEFDAAAETLVLQGRKRVEGRWSLDEVALLEDADAAVVFAPDEVALQRGVRQLAELDLREGWEALLKDARSCKDPELLGEFADEAGLAGADFDELERVLQERERLLKRPGRPSDATLSDLKGRRWDLRDIAFDALWTRVQQLEPGPARTALLREVLAEQPGHRGALALVTEMLPETLRPTGAADTAAWLELALTLDLYGGQRVGSTAEDSRTAEADAEDVALLAEARTNWRNDLVGWRTSGVLVMAPRDQPRALARGLATAELTTIALRKLLGGRACRLGEPAPLVLHVTSDPDEYVRLVNLGDWYPDRPLVRRIRSGKLRLAYVPDELGPPMRRPTPLIQELVKLWLALRCAGESVPAERTGAWLGDGLVQALGELALEPASGSWRPELARPLSLDVVATASDAQLLDWAQVYAATTTTLGAWSEDETTRSLAVNLQIDLTRELDALDIYTCQAAATWHYLLSEEGGSRGLDLGSALDQAYDRYEATPGVDVLLGLAPEELGAEVRAWSQRYVDGLRR